MYGESQTHWSGKMEWRRMPMMAAIWPVMEHAHKHLRDTGGAWEMTGWRQRGSVTLIREWHWFVLVPSLNIQASFLRTGTYLSIGTAWNLKLPNKPLCGAILIHKYLLGKTLQPPGSKIHPSTFIEVVWKEFRLEARRAELAAFTYAAEVEPLDILIKIRHSEGSWHPWALWRPRGSRNQ